MYEQNARWNEYYRELEPEKRKEQLDLLCMTEPDDGANEYRLTLFKVRYEDENIPDKYVDRFLFQCVNFIQIYRGAKLFKRNSRKEVERTLKELHFGDAALYGEAGTRALYWELRNTAARYFETCRSAGYGRALFGLLKSNEVSKIERSAADAFKMSLGLATRLEMQDSLRVWNEAVHDAYLAFDTQAGKSWQDICRKMSN